MSHFVIGVIVEDPNDVDMVMEPFREFDGDDYGIEHVMEFSDHTDEVVNAYSEYLQGLAEPLIDGNYMSLEEFANEDGYTHNLTDPYAPKWGYMYNPQGIWDWYVVGGRWSGELKTKDGESVNYAQIKDINFDVIEEDRNEAIRFWEIVVEKRPLLEGEESIFSMWTPEYYIERYGNKEGYVNHFSRMSTYGVIDYEGNYYEQGRMGWFGMTDANAESTNDYKAKFDEIIKNANPEHYFVLVDCHI
jgi:hypothetical protein